MLTHLVEGETLRAGQSLTSPNRKFVTYMSTQGHVTLYRFEAGRDPVNMWRFFCYHQRPFGNVWMGIRGGFLAGGDQRRHNRPETPWWGRPRNGLGRRPSNTILVVQDDGNMVLYARNAQSVITSAEWATGTNGRHEAAIDPSLPVAMISAGTLAVNANTLIVNTLPTPITVSDSQTAATVAPNNSVGVHSPAGPGSLAIDVRAFAYDLDTGSSNATVRPQVRADRSGNTIRLVSGRPTPFAWHESLDDTFSHLQLPWETQALADEKYAKDFEIE